MSIIHDALKKVEASTVRNDAREPSGKKADFKVYILYLLVAALGFISANLIFSFFNKATQKTAKPVIKALPPKPVSPAPPPLPSLTIEKEEKAPGQLKLNGIFFSGNDGYALINNQIVKTGDEVSGAEVLRITLDGVELKYADKTINLSNQSK